MNKRARNSDEKKGTANSTKSAKSGASRVWLTETREREVNIERITINDMLNTSSANYNLSLMRVEILINYGKLMLDSNLNEIQLMMEWSGKLHL